LEDAAEKSDFVVSEKISTLDFVGPEPVQTLGRFNDQSRRQCHYIRTWIEPMPERIYHEYTDKRYELSWENLPEAIVRKSSEIFRTLNVPVIYFLLEC